VALKPTHICKRNRALSWGKVRSPGAGLEPTTPSLPPALSRLELAAQPALAAITTGPFVAPASDADDDLMAFVRRHAQTLYHPTSTCAIGAVVDADLKSSASRASASPTHP
jgi:GMC oxidoreductase